MTNASGGVCKRDRWDSLVAKFKTYFVFAKYNNVPPIDRGGLGRTNN